MFQVKFMLVAAVMLTCCCTGVSWSAPLLNSQRTIMTCCKLMLCALLACFGCPHGALLITTMQ